MARIEIVPIAEIETPCTGVCRLRRGRCQGCKRTPDEITRWTSMPADERRRLMAELPRRA